jgi:hypothetical protein
MHAASPVGSSWSYEPEDLTIMKASTELRAGHRLDIITVAAVLVVVTLGWLLGLRSAPIAQTGTPHPGCPAAAHACLARKPAPGPVHRTPR